MSHVAFVVPARNEARHLDRCLRSILAQDRSWGAQVSVSLVVVDNASTDATVEIALRLGAEIVRVPPGNAGRARNAGAKHSPHSDLIAFVDADCVLPAGWLRAGLEHLAAPQVVAVGSVQAVAPRDAPWVERAWVENIAPTADQPWQAVTWLPAFNLLVRKAAFDAIGGFDEALTTCEDSDLSFRLARQGELRRDYRQPVRHLGESQSLPEFFRREMWRSRGNFRSAWKRGSVIAELPSLVVPFGYVVVSAATMAALGLMLAWPQSWWLAAALVAGTAAIPVGIAIWKRRRIQGCGLSGLLMAAYLLARGLGPLWPVERVARG